MRFFITIAGVYVYALAIPGLFISSQHLQEGSLERWLCLVAAGAMLGAIIGRLVFYDSKIMSLDEIDTGTARSGRG